MHVLLRLAALAVIGSLSLGFLARDERPAQAALDWLGPPVLELKPSYRLVDHRGHPVSDATLRGRLVLLTFGTMGCDATCRDLLAEQAVALDALEGATEEVAFVFVTLDPTRDAPERLRAFAQAIDPRLMALRGTPQAVAATANAFRLAYDDAPGAAPAFAVMTYLLGRDGKLRQLLPAGMTAPEIAALLEPLLEE